MPLFSSAQPSLWLIDFSFTCQRAHAYNFCCAIKKLERDLVIFAPFDSDLEITEHTDAQRVLSVHSDQVWQLPIIKRRFVIGQFHDFCLANYYCFRTLSNLSATYPCAATVYFGSCDFRQLVGIACWLATTTAIKTKRIRITLMEDLDAPINAQWRYLRLFFWQISFYILRFLTKGVDLILLSDTDKRVQSLSTFSKIKTQYAFHPVQIDQHLKKLSPSQSKVVSMIGNLRLERGIEDFIKAVVLLEPERKSGNLRIRINLACAPLLDKVEKHLLVLLEQLRGLAGVELSCRSLSKQEYFSLLYSSDIIVLPYDAVAYANKSSGIAIEALCAGIPVIATSDTWIEKELKNFNSGQFFPNKNVPALAQAIREVITNYQQHYDQAQAAATQACASYNAKEFLRLIKS